MSKKHTFLVLGLLMSFLGMTGCGTKTGTRETEEVAGETKETTGDAVEITKEIDTLASAKTDFYASIEELETTATVIVRIKKTDKEKNVVEHPVQERQDVFYGYTKSMVQVEEIMKNTSGQQIEIGDEIRILENQFTHVDGDTKVTCHLEQYKMMETGNEYILYLDYSKEEEWYGILGVLQGKIPVSEEEDILFPVSRITYYDGQPGKEEDSEMQRVMEEIRKDTLERYN